MLNLLNLTLKPMTKPFSPAAQAVLDAFIKGPYSSRLSVAAALRAAADQMVPEEPLYEGDQRWMFERDARQACRNKLFAIAAELESNND